MNYWFSTRKYRGGPRRGVTFVLHNAEDGGDRYSLLETRVEEMGTLFLHERRKKALTREDWTQLTASPEFLDGVSAIPDMSNYRETRQVDLRLSQDCEDILRKVMRETRRKNPKAFVWDKGQQLPVLLFGGGAHLPVYRDAVLGLDGFGVHKDGLRLVSLEVPENFRVSPQEYARLAVAYGLSFLEIGEVVEATEPVEQEKAGIVSSSEWLSEDRVTGKDVT